MLDSVSLYPQPRRLRWLDGATTLSSDIMLRAQEPEEEYLADKLNVRKRCGEAIADGSTGPDAVGVSSVTVIEIVYNADLHEQGYVFEWNHGVLHFEAAAEKGLHYAMVSFEQLIKRQGLEWNHFRIEDEPDFPVRGVMLDIGRNKIPKMETLYTLIDRLSELKINHLQLYMEGFCFDYGKYRSSFPDATPISAAEFRELDAYARSRYIDLVPNQNCLGHMAPWLAKPEFRELAEHPDGMPTPLGFTLPATTLNPADARSVQLAKDLFDDLLPNFSSEYANINLDEPFGLGKGQSKAQADEAGIGKLYLEYAGKMAEIVRRHGKKTLMWGDVLTKHPDLIPLLPKDVTVLDWNYESRVSFERNGRLLRDAGVAFYVCPGTSSWSSITGRTDNMLANIADAAKHGKAFGAAGLLVTDWGDQGHWQSLAVSYPGFAYAAGVGWQFDANAGRLEQLEGCLNDCIFNDRSGMIGSLLLELGRYENLENSNLENMTYTHALLNRGITSRDKLESEAGVMMKILEAFGSGKGPFKLDYQYDSMQEWLALRKEQLSKLELERPDAILTVAELENAIRLIEQGIGLHRLVHRVGLPDDNATSAWLKQLKSELEIAIAEFRRLWQVRNRKAGLDSSLEPLYKLLSQYDEMIGDEG